MEKGSAGLAGSSRGGQQHPSRIGVRRVRRAEVEKHARRGGVLKREPGKPPASESLPEDDEPDESQLFPMTTGQAANHLGSRGYNCKPQMVELLVENGLVRPSSPDTWTGGRTWTRLPTTSRTRKSSRPMLRCDGEVATSTSCCKSERLRFLCRDVTGSAY